MRDDRTNERRARWGARLAGAGLHTARMRADGRVGGHFVQGHIDGTGIVEEIRPDGDSHWLTISFDRSLSPYLIRKGSIAVDGVSLTVAGLGGGHVGRRRRVRKVAAATAGGS